MPEAVETIPIPPLQYRDLEQQRESAEFGMWVFLSTELLLFGALFMSYIVCRHSYPEDFAHYSHELNALVGTINTAVLIISSVGMVIAAYGAKTGSRVRLIGGLAIAALLGTVFMVLKGYEYYQHYLHRDFPGLAFDPGTRGKQVYFFLYFAMTGLHAIHLTIGVLLVLYILWRAVSRSYSRLYYTPVENVGLYWHFVDIVWIFLYPLFYLIDLHK